MTGIENYPIHLSWTAFLIWSLICLLFGMFLCKK